MESVDINFPENEAEISSLGASILKRFDLISDCLSIPAVDEIFQFYHRHIVVLNIKGLTYNLLSENLDQFQFLNKQILKTYIPSGKKQDSNQTVDGYFTEITKTIQKKGKAWGHTLISSDIPSANFSTLLKNIKQSTKTPEQTITYASWNGLQNNKEGLQNLNFELESFCDSLKESCVFIIAEAVNDSESQNEIPFIWHENKQKSHNWVATFMQKDFRFNTGIIGWIAVTLLLILILGFILFRIF